MRLTCKEASRLLSQGLDRDLPLAQRAALRLHLTLCDACTRVKRQFEFMRRALGAYSAGEVPGPDRPDDRLPPK
jgi:hypothetical protein